MKFRRGYLSLLAVPVLAIGLAACGGSSNSSSTGANGSAGGSISNASQTIGGSETVATKSVSGVGTVLVDSQGRPLYTNNKDSGSMIACSGSCASIWVPLQAPSSGQPTSSDSAVQAKLGVLKGQVTFNGKPLYTFVQDGPGQATGNGVMDSFDGTSFTWTAATTGGAPASTSSSSASSGSSGSGSSGGYGY
jgi:predicted lipoprotein with Yx(FWY)xxD motif